MSERQIERPAGPAGFTLLEVMIAVSIIAIAFTTLLSSQSQSVSVANNIKFDTMASLLGQEKMAEYEVMAADRLGSDSGDFGEDFPGFFWTVEVSDVNLPEIETDFDYLKQVDLVVTWGQGGQYRYALRFYRYVAVK